MGMLRPVHIPGLVTLMVPLSAFGIEIIRRIQPDAAAADVDAVANRLLCFEVEDGSAAPSKPKDHVLAQECELLREGGFEVFFEELAVPALPLHEAHVDPRHGDSIGEQATKMLHIHHQPAIRRPASACQAPLSSPPFLTEALTH